jgi:hypothetical protein
MPHPHLTGAAAALAVALLAAPAHAGQVTVVDGPRAERRHDPFVPEAADSALAPPGALARAAGKPRPRPKRRRPTPGQRALAGSLRGALAAGEIDRAEYERHRRAYAAARRAHGRLRGVRRRELAYPIAVAERLALERRLSATRMPQVFLQLERNTQYWRYFRLPRSREHVSFRGSGVLFQYFPGRGLQLHPLATFKKANLLHGECTRAPGSCQAEAIRQLLDEMERLAVRRGRGFVAWEYMFEFGGGSPPWMSGMAQATGVQALGRAAALLGEPRYAELARRALGAFDAPPPTGVRTTGPGGGVHYLQYSFAPRLFVFNAFVQALIGLSDFARLGADPTARRLYAEAEPEARAEVPMSDVGDWSRYSFRGRESNSGYHELLRELLQSMCSRRLGALYCDYAARYRRYQTEPPELTLDAPEFATAKQVVRIRFEVTKLAAVELKVFKGRRLAHERLASFRRGSGWFAWRPRSPGLYTVRLAAKELRTGLGLKDRDVAEIEVEREPEG